MWLARLLLVFVCCLFLTNAVQAAALLTNWGRTNCFVPIQDPDGGPTVLPALAPTEPAENFRLLRDDQRWVVLDGASQDDAAGLFPGKDVVTQALAVQGPAVAWEAADAIVFGPGRLSAARVGPLLSAGLTVVSTSNISPDGPWVWQQAGSGWKTSFAIAGPQGRFSTDVYSAINLRPVGRPIWARYRVVLMAGLFVLAALAAMLLRRRAALMVMVVATVASVGLMRWTLSHEPVAHQRIRVIIQNGALQQVDQWMVQKSLDQAVLHVDPEVMGWPVYRSRAHALQMPMQVRPGDLSVQLKSPLILLHRKIEPAQARPDDMPAVTPALRAVASLYEGNGVELIGVQPATRDQQLDILWLARRSPTVARLQPPPHFNSTVQ
jgi:hypothetical protein